MVQKLDKNNYTSVGYIKKTHGVKGELMLSFDEGIDEICENFEFLFFEIEGLLVPFYVEKAESSSNSLARFNFRYIDSKEKAQSYVGNLIFADKKEIQLDADYLNPQLLKGFMIVDINLGEIGKIEYVNDFGGNFVFSVNYKNEEVLVPFAEELIVNFDQEESIIEMKCPEGLFDLSE